MSTSGGYPPQDNGQPGFQGPGFQGHGTEGQQPHPAGQQPQYGQQSPDSQQFQQGQPQQYGQPNQYSESNQYSRPQYGQQPPQGPQQPYAQPNQYGQPQYGQPQYNQPNQWQQPLPKKSNKNLFIGLGIGGGVLVLAVLALVLVMIFTLSPSNKLTEARDKFTNAIISGDYSTAHSYMYPEFRAKVDSDTLGTLIQGLGINSSCKADYSLSKSQVDPKAKIPVQVNAGSLKCSGEDHAYVIVLATDGDPQVVDLYFDEDATAVINKLKGN